MRWPDDLLPPAGTFALRDQGALPDALIRACWEACFREPRAGEQRRETEGR